jgi:DNA-directed RNA polymerase specialized sigma24 family protein
VTRWIALLKAGDPTAVQPLWQDYFLRLSRLARARLRITARGAADEEDVALSAFDSFCRRAEHGQFPRLEDRDDLWQLLVVLTVRKAANLIHHEGRQSRGRGRLRRLSDVPTPELERLLGAEPSPEFAAEAADECRRLLDRLGDATLRQVALWKLEAYTNAEIAAELGCAETTVERKLRSIRRIWDQEPTP